MIQELQTERLDINNKYEVFTTCKQGDNLKLKIIVYDKSLPADLSNYTCRLRAFKRDQMPLIQNTGITITNNIVYIEGDEQLTTTAGIVKAELQFVHKTTLQKKSSFYIIFNVISSVFNVDGAVSTPTCTLLKQLENDLDRVENIGYVLEDAKDTRDDLIVKTDAANTSNENLVNSTSTADTTKNALDTLNTNANTTKLALDTANTTAVTNKNNLDVANVQAVKNYEALEQLGDATDLAKKVEAQGSQLNDIMYEDISNYKTLDDALNNCTNIQLPKGIIELNSCCSFFNKRLRGISVEESFIKINSDGGLLFESQTGEQFGSIENVTFLVDKDSINDIINITIKNDILIGALRLNNIRFLPYNNETFNNFSPNKNHYAYPIGNYTGIKLLCSKGCYSNYMNNIEIINPRMGIVFETEESGWFTGFNLNKFTIIGYEIAMKLCTRSYSFNVNFPVLIDTRTGGERTAIYTNSKGGMSIVSPLIFNDGQEGIHYWIDITDETDSITVSGGQVEGKINGEEYLYKHNINTYFVDRKSSIQSEFNTQNQSIVTTNINNILLNSIFKDNLKYWSIGNANYTLLDDEESPTLRNVNLTSKGTNSATMYLQQKIPKNNLLIGKVLTFTVCIKANHDNCNIQLIDGTDGVENTSMKSSPVTGDNKYHIVKVSRLIKDDSDIIIARIHIGDTTDESCNVAWATLSIGKTSSTNYLSSNSFIKTSSSGNSTISSNTSSLIVNHGLDITPSTSDIAIVFTSQLDTGLNWWLSDVTSTSFTINISSNVTSNVNFSWKIN